MLCFGLEISVQILGNFFFYLMDRFVQTKGYDNLKNNGSIIGFDKKLKTTSCDKHVCWSWYDKNTPVRNK